MATSRYRGCRHNPQGASHAGDQCPGAMTRAAAVPSEQRARYACRPVLQFKPAREQAMRCNAGFHDRCRSKRYGSLGAAALASGELPGPVETIMSGTRLRIDYGLHTDRIQLAQMTQLARI